MADVELSVVILTYNNPSVAISCIESCARLNHEAYEIIVVDNASTDDTSKVIAETYPDVRLLTRTTNSPVAARNEGFRAANGRFILSLDHDMVIDDPEFATRAVQVIDAFPDVGVMMPRICGRESAGLPLSSHWWHRRSIDEADNYFFSRFFPEGAVIFRSEALDQTGGYDERFFHVAESVDLAMRMHRLGWRILYCPELATTELIVSDHVSRSPTKTNEYSLRNRLWVCWKHYPAGKAAGFGASRMAIDLLRSIRFGWFRHWLAAVRHGVFAPPDIRADREPLSAELWRRLDELEAADVAPPANRPANRS